MLRSATILLLYLSTLPLAAQAVSSDLNDDGLRERFTLIERDGWVVLQIENTDGGAETAEQVAR